MKVEYIRKANTPTIEVVSSNMVDTHLRFKSNEELRITMTGIDKQHKPAFTITDSQGSATQLTLEEVHNSIQEINTYEAGL